MYFHHQFPFGEDNIDLGLCVNPFSFDDGTNEEDKKLANTDLGLARAYQVSLRNGAKTDQYIALSYESGLEIFPPMVAVSKENTIARGVLRQSLELIEANINWWWERYKSDYWGPSKVVSFLPLVEKILIRTPYWQFAIDDSFIPGDRKLIFEQIAVTTRTSETIEEFLASSNAMIGRKILETSRRIAKVL